MDFCVTTTCFKSPGLVNILNSFFITTSGSFCFCSTSFFSSSGGFLKAKMHTTIIPMTTTAAAIDNRIIFFFVHAHFLSDCSDTGLTLFSLFLDLGFSFGFFLFGKAISFVLRLISSGNSTFSC